MTIKAEFYGIITDDNIVWGGGLTESEAWENAASHYRILVGKVFCVVNGTRLKKMEEERNFLCIPCSEGAVWVMQEQLKPNCPYGIRIVSVPGFGRLVLTEAEVEETGLKTERA